MCAAGRRRKRQKRPSQGQLLPMPRPRRSGRSAAARQDFDVVQRLQDGRARIHAQHAGLQRSGAGRQRVLQTLPRPPLGEEHRDPQRLSRSVEPEPTRRGR
jgi:hypothetical protein